MDVTISHEPRGLLKVPRMATTLTQAVRKTPRRPVRKPVIGASRSRDELKKLETESNEQIARYDGLIERLSGSIVKLEQSLRAETGEFDATVQDLHGKLPEKGETYVDNAIETMPGTDRLEKTLTRKKRALALTQKKKAALQAEHRALRDELLRAEATDRAQDVVARFQRLVKLVNDGKEEYQSLFADIAGLKNMDPLIGGNGRWMNYIERAGAESWVLTMIDSHMADLSPSQFLGWLFKASRLMSCPLRDDYVQTKVSVRTKAKLFNAREYGSSEPFNTGR